MNVVKSVGNKNTSDYNGLSMIVIKNVVLNIAEPITFIYNMSLYHGYFPQRIKISKVMPIHKSGHKHIFTNYRPISQLPQFSKILQKISYIKLQDFIEKIIFLQIISSGLEINAQLQWN